MFSKADFLALCTSAKTLKRLSLVALPGATATTTLTGLRFFLEREEETKHLKSRLLLKLWHKCFEMEEKLIESH